MTWLGNGAQGAVNIGSAPIGAILLGFLPMQGILAIDVVTAMVAVTSLFFIVVPQPMRGKATEASSGAITVWQDLREGLRYVWGWPGLVMILVMATLINLMIAPAFALHPLLVTRHFSGQAIHLAWMESSWGIGVVVGGLTLSAWGGFKRKPVTSLVGLFVMGIAMVVVGVSSPSAFWLAVLMLFVGGYTNPMVSGPLFAVIQSAVSPEMQGCVFISMLSASAAMTPLGLIIAGPLADRLGLQSWFIAGGVISALLGLGAFFVPTIENIEDDLGREAKSIAEVQAGEAPIMTAKAY
jgi:DHA3 family macrolide efflux protein-like MFS transporter